MPSEESIRAEASTVHRSGQAEPLESKGPSVDVEQIAQAKTVIRGSSHANQPLVQSGRLNQSPAEVAKVLLGRSLNHFRLEELIGGGGMGAVFRAHDEKLDRTVAIKVIPHVRDDADLQRRYRNEAQSAAKLDHPRIARVFDAGIQDEWHYIVFEYIEGTNIRDLVNHNGVLSIDEAVFYTSQLADALQHAADRGIVHRDIKPSNVLLGQEGKLKLVDMGLARSDSLDLSEDMTASGVTLGTFDYISPEQARDPRDADLRSDLYSLGCTLYFMVTGQPPYPGGTMLQKLLSHGNAPPPNPRELRPEISENLVAVIQKMLAKNPSDRYQIAGDLIADLREVASRDGLIRSQTLGPVTISEPSLLFRWLEQHGPWVVAVALLLAIGGWLRLDSAANRQDITVPPSAMRPSNARPATTPADGLDQASLSEEPMRPPTQSEPETLLDSAVGSDSDSVDSSPLDSITDREPGDPIDSGGESQPSSSGGVAEPNTLTVAGQPDLPDPGLTDPEADFSAMVPGEINIELDSELAAAPRLIRLVSADEMTAEPKVAHAVSLQEAFDLAAMHDLDRIEIATPTVVSGPVQLRRDVLVTSTVPGGSRVRFVTGVVRSMERTRMCKVGDHQVEFEDLHFIWDVPSREFEGGAIFEIHDNPLVRLTDCTVTVNNPTLQDEVFAFEVITDPQRLSFENREPIGDYPEVWLELNNVIVRGQMTMLGMDYAAKLMVFWDNGLLAVTERMIDTAGALKELPLDAEPILLSLTYVTAHAPLGIMRTRVGVSGSYAAPVDRFARKCVFWVDPSLPYFEFLGIPSLQPPAPLLTLRGASNAYDVEPTLADPILRLFAADGEMSITRMNELAVSTPAWADDLRPTWEVDWMNDGIAGIPANARNSAHYSQNGVSPSGFDVNSLPNLPDETSVGEVNDSGPVVREEQTSSDESEES